MEQAAIYELLTETFGDAIEAWHETVPEPFALVKADKIFEVAKFLREDSRLTFETCMCLSGIDWAGFDEKGKGKSVKVLGYNEDGTPETSDYVAEGDLGVAYNLYSHLHGHEFNLQVRIPREGVEVPSVSSIWPTAAWHEREAFDLVGVLFSGHPDFRRILLEDHWEGHPLRKDYQMPSQWDSVPLEGKPYSKNPHPKPEVPEPSGTDEPSEG